MTKYVSIEDCTGKTRTVYYLLRNNLYDKNWKDAPALKNYMHFVLGAWVTALGGFLV